jgi:hypothetical protein
MPVNAIEMPLHCFYLVVALSITEGLTREVASRAIASGHLAILADVGTGGFVSQHCGWFARVRMNGFAHVVIQSVDR